MSKMPKIILAGVCFLSVLFLAGCATRYQAKGFTGGYSEIVRTRDSFIVNFQGNRFTSSETVMKYALMRASELTLQNGYKYFEVVSSKDESSTYSYSTTHNEVNGKANAHRNSTNIHGSSSSSTYSGTEVKPGISLTIKCYKIEPKEIDVIDAAYFLTKNV